MPILVTTMKKTVYRRTPFAGEEITYTDGTRDYHMTEGELRCIDCTENYEYTGLGRLEWEVLEDALRLVVEKERHGMTYGLLVTVVDLEYDDEHKFGDRKILKLAEPINGTPLFVRDIYGQGLYVSDRGVGVEGLANFLYWVETCEQHDGSVVIDGPTSRVLLYNTNLVNIGIASSNGNNPHENGDRGTKRLNAERYSKNAWVERIYTLSHRKDGSPVITTYVKGITEKIPLQKHVNSLYLPSDVPLVAAR